MSVISTTYFQGAGVAFTTVSTVGPVEWMDPLPGQASPVMFRQAFMQAISSFSAQNLNTPHPTLTTFLLTEESGYSVVGGGIQKWNRTFATTPPQRIEYSTMAATFPGYKTGISGTVYRDPVSATSPVKITYDYYLLGSLPSLGSESRAVITSTGDSPLLSEIYLWPGSSPTFGQYNALITTDQTASSFSLTAEPQSLERWEGNFYARKTVNIKAK
jgi:hypothetical protein